MIFSKEAFGQELVQAASAHIGKPAVYHWKFAGNCLDPEIQGQCFDGGMGPQSFDCSGLIASAVSEVIGQSVDDWPSALRHVRDMWAASGEPFDTSIPPKIGDILVQAYISLKSEIRPGHIGIIVSSNPEQVEWLHASPTDGEVLISPVPESARILGTYAVNL